MYHIFWRLAPSITVFPLKSLCILLEAYRNKAVQVPFGAGICNYTNSGHFVHRPWVWKSLAAEKKLGKLKGRNERKFSSLEPGLLKPGRLPRRWQRCLSWLATVKQERDNTHCPFLVTNTSLSEVPLINHCSEIQVPNQVSWQLAINSNHLSVYSSVNRSSVAWCDKVFLVRKFYYKNSKKKHISYLFFTYETLFTLLHASYFYQ